MKKTRFYGLFFSVAMIFGMCSCNNNSNSSDHIIKNEESTMSESKSTSAIVEEPTRNSITVSELKTLSNGKTVVYVDDKPFKSIGVQIRTDAYKNCDHLTVDQFEIFFAKAAELGVNTVEVPIEWKDIEVGDNVFDFTYLDKLLTFTNKYKLKLEILWFGSNMCGDTHSYSVPEYILCDGKTYPKFDAIRTGEFWSYYGMMWFLDFSNDNLIAREGAAITKTLNHVYDFDQANGQTHPVVAFQVLNEADCFMRFRLGSSSVVSRTTGLVMEWAEAEEMSLKAFDAYGKAAKASAYKVYTRVNLASSTSNYGISSDNSFSKASIKNAPDWVKRIMELDGIDAVGDDPYTKKIKEIKGISYMLGNKAPGNFSHIAENAGDYSNTGSLIFAAFSQGAGYNIYDLATPPFFISHASSATVDQGVCHYVNGELVNSTHFNDVQNAINLLKKCGDTLITFNPDDMACFNTNKTNPEQTCNQTIQTSHARLVFGTNSGGIGFAVSDDNHLDIGATSLSNITIYNANIADVKVGFYDANNNFNGTSLGAQSSFELQGGLLYRVEFSSKPSPLTSNTWNFIGGDE